MEGYWKIQGENSSGALLSISVPRVALLPCTGWAQPLPYMGPGHKQAVAPGQLSFQRKEWLQCGGELGTCLALTAGPICVTRPAPPSTGRDSCCPLAGGRSGMIRAPSHQSHSCGQAGAKFIPDTSLSALLDLDPR